MIPVDIEITFVPKGFTKVTYAKDQPEYIPLPAIVEQLDKDPLPADLARYHGSVITRWKPSAAELELLLAGDDIRLEVWTFGNVCQKCGAFQGLQPVKLGMWSDAVACVDGNTGP